MKSAQNQKVSVTIICSVIQEIIILHRNLRIMEYILIESLKHDSFRTQWEAWVLELAEAVRQTDIRIPRTWTILKPLSENIQAMIWLTEKLRKL